MGAARAAGAAGGAGGAGARGAAGAAADLANLNVNPLGDWSTQAEDPQALFGALSLAVVRRRAAAGDREAQWSQGVLLMSMANQLGNYLDAPATSPKAQVGLELNFAPTSFCLRSPYSNSRPTRSIDVVT